jgi:alkanesulfonate monooxygenase SsuD/methylene tetrahydromethanopterin reductase-like flavin-dependent oxidoreductase (luciferase family)
MDSIHPGSLWDIARNCQSISESGVPSVSNHEGIGLGQEVSLVIVIGASHAESPTLLGMPDYHHDLLFGISVPPTARDHRALLATAELADELGIDIIGFQDHPYQARFLDAWTLLSYVAGRTQHIRLFPNVANIPLRPPAVLARSAAALDILSNGRVELGLGAGAFIDAIVSMGGPRRTVPELVDALEEAISVIRELLEPGPPANYHGTYYSLAGAQPGPTPPHPIAIWLGAYKKRMLQLTGRAADAWIPSLGYASLEDLGRMNLIIDAAAEDAGRKPSDVRRGFNVSGSFATQSSGFLQGPASDWAEQLTELALTDGISAFNLAVSPMQDADVRRWADEIAPAVREAVAKQRQVVTASPPRMPEVKGDGATEAAGRAAREAQRLVVEDEQKLAVGRAGQQTLLAIHQHLRQELSNLREVIEEVGGGRSTAAQARSYLNTMTMRQNYWTLGAFCAAYCRVVSVHHAIEDQSLFPDLTAADQSLGPIIGRLQQEHEEIAKVLGKIDAALVAMVESDERIDGTQSAVDHLSDALLAHLKYEEDSLLEPIGRLAIRI